MDFFSTGLTDKIPDETYRVLDNTYYDSVMSTDDIVYPDADRGDIHALVTNFNTTRPDSARIAYSDSGDVALATAHEYCDGLGQTYVTHTMETYGRSSGTNTVMYDPGDNRRENGYGGTGFDSITCYPTAEYTDFELQINIDYSQYVLTVYILVILSVSAFYVLLKDIFGKG